MTMHPMQECVQRLCNKIDKIKLFANLGARLFQETGGLSRWQELINNEKKKLITKKEKKKRKLVCCLRGSRRHSKKNRVHFGMQ